jgi:hypothetical protein
VSYPQPKRKNFRDSGSFLMLYCDLGTAVSAGIIKKKIIFSKTKRKINAISKPLLIYFIFKVRIAGLPICRPARTAP